MALDVTECPVQKSIDYAVQKVLYSGKAGTHTIKYEIGTELTTGLIVWFCGLYPGSVHDFKIAQTSGILKCLLPGEFIMANEAYIGNLSFITPVKAPKTEREHKWNSIICQKRVIVENTLNQIKIFNCTSKEWCHKIEYHALAMKFIMNIINIDLKFRPLRK
jgi:hypothetical protein